MTYKDIKLSDQTLNKSETHISDYDFTHATLFITFTLSPPAIWCPADTNTEISC